MSKKQTLKGMPRFFSIVKNERETWMILIKFRGTSSHGLKFTPATGYEGTERMINSMCKFTFIL